MITLIAKSAWFRYANWMPTTFSMALPAIATMTRPANAWDTPSASIAGSREDTNQSETSAAATLAPVSMVTASHSGHRGPSCSAGDAGPGDSTAGARLSADGNDSRKTPSSTTDTTI